MALRRLTLLDGLTIVTLLLQSLSVLIMANALWDPDAYDLIGGVTFGGPIGFVEQGRDVRFLITTQLWMVHYFRTVSNTVLAHSINADLTNVSAHPNAVSSFLRHKQPAVRRARRK
jgi:hypothetical protein